MQHVFSVLLAGTLLALVAVIPISASAAEIPTPNSSRAVGSWTYCGGPLGGLGYDVRMHPTGKDTMLVTDSFAGAFRSTDGGLNWAPSSSGISTYGGTSGDALKVFCLTIDPIDPNIVWCGLQDYRGIFKSTDNGATWTEKVNGIEETEGLSMRGFTVDPYNSDVVYAAGEISSYAWAGSTVVGREQDRTMGVVYKTDDGGDNWVEAWRGDNLARYVWIDPRNPDVLYVSTGFFDREAANTDTTTNEPGGVGILKSLDGGQNWEQKNDGLGNLYVPSLFMHPLDPDVLIAACGSVPWPDSGGVYLTTNGGESWTRTLDQGSNSVEISVADPQIVYAGDPVAIFRSTDGGLTWEQRTPAGAIWGPPGVEAGFPVDFQVDPNDPDRIFTNNYGGGNFLSTDGGHTWVVASKGYTGAHVRDVAVAAYDPARVYAAARSGMFRSDDWGLEWDGLDYAPAYGVEWNVVTLSPHDPLHVLASNNQEIHIVESHDGGDTWRIAGGILPSGMAWRCFAFARSDPLIIYGGTGAFQTASVFKPDLPALGVSKSTDAGLTWTAANDSTSQFANVADLAVESQNALVVYAATTNHGILKTTNGGGDWIARNVGLPPGPMVLSVAIDPSDSTHVLAGMDDTGLYESFDGGLNWQSIAVGLPAEADVTTIVFSPVNPNLVFVGDQRSGVYRSTDAGVSWIRANTGLRNRAVNDLAFSADGETLYAGIEGEGVYRFDGADGGVVAVRDGNSPRSATGAGLQRIYSNPSGGSTTIAFTLATRARATLWIFDARGRLVRTLLDESRGEGSHRVVWDGRDEGGALVASGVYFCRLRGGEVDEAGRLVLIR